MRKIIFQFIIAGFALVALVSATAVWAASTASISARVIAGSGSDLSVEVYVNTGGKAFNVFEGEIVVPPRSARIVNIADGDSVISFWVQPPNSNADTGSIHFKGAAAGAVSTDHGKLFTIVLAPITGVPRVPVDIVVRNSRGYLSDGMGTPEPIIGGTIRLNFTSSTAPSAIVNATSTSLIDDSGPTDLRLARGQSSALFDNQWFAAFSARDANSGVDRFEIQESVSATPVESAWQPAANPYVLHDQSLKRYIHLRAFDKSGNSSIITLAPADQGTISYTKFLFWCILVAILIVLLVVVWRRSHSLDNLAPRQ